MRIERDFCQLEIMGIILKFGAIPNSKRKPENKPEWADPANLDENLDAIPDVNRIATVNLLSAYSIYAE